MRGADRAARVLANAPPDLCGAWISHLYSESARYDRYDEELQSAAAGAHQDAQEHFRDWHAEHVTPQRRPPDPAEFLTATKRVCQPGSLQAPVQGLRACGGSNGCRRLACAGSAGVATAAAAVAAADAV